MCGIAGFLDPRNSTLDPVGVVTKMALSLRHRGPDDIGHWLSADRKLALGHTRLSIIDLSPTGHQPMASGSGRFTMVFNGEIYNFRELRAKLAPLGHQFRGNSDTEVLLAAVEQWGLERALTLSVGMFAFALWDAETSQLHLVRDRVGKKPLYYGRVGSCLIFGSELKALRSYPGLKQDIDRESLSLYFRLGYVPAPFAILDGIGKVQPGCIVTVQLRDGHVDVARPKPYWSARGVFLGEPNLEEQTDEEAIEQLHGLLNEAVALRMISDVPLGAFLSGGIDSSTVVALMQKHSNRPVKTFSIGFREQGYDEAPPARAVANHLGTDHTELYVEPEEARDVIPMLPSMYDEPFADSSQIPTYLISRLARSCVTVSLSGDGGDELFGGYNRYNWGNRIWKRSRPFPPAVRRGIGRAVRSVSPRLWDAVGGTLNRFVPARYRFTNPADKFSKFANVIGAESAADVYRSLVSHWTDASQIVIRGREPATPLSFDAHPVTDNFVQSMMYLDFISYLPDDILVKLDRASMAVSLEGRVPFLDHRVVEYAARLPLERKIREGTGKWILRQVLYRFVPQELVNRPKAGFGVPIDAWLRGPLKDWASELLDSARIASDGYLNAEEVNRKWKEHLSGRSQWQHQLWDILMFQAWLREWH